MILTIINVLLLSVGKNFFVLIKKYDSFNLFNANSTNSTVSLFKKSLGGS